MTSALHFSIRSAGKAEERVAETAANPVLLGAAPDCSVLLEAPPVSSRHATIERAAWGVLLRDHSTNGTFIRGQRVASQPLASGETFTIPPFDITITWSPGDTPRRWPAGGWNQGPHTLRLLHGPGDQPREIPVGARAIVLGTSPTSSVQIHSTHAADLHAELLAMPGGWIKVRDLGTTNGTFLNGHRIQLGFAAPGDSVAFGPDIWYQVV